MGEGKSPGLRAGGWSLALLDHWKVATIIICNYWVCLVTARWLVRYVLRTCRIGVRHMSFDSNTVCSPVNGETLESNLQPVHVLLRGCSNSKQHCRLQFLRCWLKSQPVLDTLSLKEYSPRLAATNTPAELAVIPATVKAGVLTRELCFLMWEKKCTACKAMYWCP